MVGIDSASAVSRTQRLRQSATTRIRTRSPFFLAAATICCFLDGDNPVPSQIERQLFVQALDERRAVLIQERDEPDRALLRMAARERERLRVHERLPGSAH